MSKKDKNTAKEKPTNQAPNQGEESEVIQLRKNLDKMFGPKKGDGSNRS